MRLSNDWSSVALILRSALDQCGVEVPAAHLEQVLIVAVTHGSQGHRRSWQLRQLRHRGATTPVPDAAAALTLFVEN